MSDVSDISTAILDAFRELGLGPASILVPLTMRENKRGYMPVCNPVESGWTLEDAPLGQYQSLVINEDGFVTREVIRQFRAFAIDGLVYEIVGGYKLASPSLGTEFKTWTFQVNPTGEEFA